MSARVRVARLLRRLSERLETPTDGPEATGPNLLPTVERPIPEAWRRETKGEGGY